MGLALLEGAILVALTVVGIVESGSQDCSQGFGSNVCSLCDAGNLNHRYTADHHPVLRVTMCNDSKVLCICWQSPPARRAVGVDVLRWSDLGRHG